MEWRLHLVSCLHMGEFCLVCVLSQKVVKMGDVSCKMESNFRDSKSLCFPSQICKTGEGMADCYKSVFH